MTTTDLSFQGRYNDAQQLIASPLTLTGTWADLGSEYRLGGAGACAAYIELDINLSLNAQVRFLAKHSSAHADEFVLPIKTVSASDVKVEDEYVEFNADADQKVIVGVELDGCVRRYEHRKPSTSSQYGPHRPDRRQRGQHDHPGRYWEQDGHGRRG
jgi:hypothetical protein